MQITKCICEQKQSNIGKTTTGVPQGSVLGTISFLIYMDDLPQTCQSDIKITLFASINKSGKGNCNMQTDVDRNCDWFNYNKLSLNPSKCETMSFGKHYQKKTVQNEVFTQKNML